MEKSTQSVDYEEFWKNFWKDSARFGPAPRHRRRIIAGLLRRFPGKSVIDVGCGSGNLIASLREMGIQGRLAGTDVSASACEYARKLVPDAHFFTLDINRESLPETYDIAVLSEVLEHLPDDVDVLRRLAPRVRYVIVSVPGGPDDKVDYHYGHYRNYPGRRMAEHLEQAGFEVIYFRRWGFPFYDVVRALISGTGKAESLVEGDYSPLKKLAATLIYYLCFLNVLPAGWQVFAMGRSRAFKD